MMNHKASVKQNRT